MRECPECGKPMPDGIGLCDDCNKEIVCILKVSFYILGILFWWKVIELAVGVK